MFPEIRGVRKASTDISVFRGLNRTEGARFSRVGGRSSAVFTEIADMKNLCSDEYPRLSTRKKRSRALEAAFSGIDSNILISGGKFIYADELGYLHYGGGSYNFESIVEEGEEHRLTLYGNRVVIMPERLVFDLGTHEFEELDFQLVSTAASLSTNPPVSGDVELNCGAFNTNLSRNFRDFSIEKVDLDDSGKPRKVNFIYEKASGLENSERQSNPGNDTSSQDDVAEAWQAEYYQHWYTIKTGETVEAQGESPSGVYRCYDISDKNQTDSGVQTHAKLRKFVKIENYYVKISRNDGTNTDIFAGLKKGDWVKISGMEHSVVSNADLSKVWGGTPPSALTKNPAWTTTDWGDYLSVLNGNTFKVYYADEKCIVIKANIEKSVPYNGAMTIERVMPDIDGGRMIEVNNRLWGCSSAANEIYSCKLGDVTNWQAYGDGTAADSYAATVGDEGGFTGIARQNDSVIFFKENWIIKLFGTKPSNFTLASYNVNGVERGSENSLVWINGTLFYLSHQGVCMYNPGGQPTVISREAFGNRKYKNAVAGRHRNKYYISAENAEGSYELFVFDTDTGLWHKEDGARMKSCTTYNNVLYYVDAEGRIVSADAENNLFEENGYSASDEGSIEWYFETPNLYADDFGKKYISKIQIAFKAAQEMTAAVFAQFRHGGAWVELRQLRPMERRHGIINVPVRRADFLRLRIEGSGDIEISGLKIDFAGGSEKAWQY